VDDYADEHHFEGEGKFGGGGERDDDAIHEEIDGYAVEGAAQDGLLDEEGQRAAKGDKDGGG
jgi:hypothetical protein